MGARSGESRRLPRGFAPAVGLAAALLAAASALGSCRLSEPEAPGTGGPSVSGVAETFGPPFPTRTGAARPEDGSPAGGLSRWNVVAEEARIPMRDGTELAATLLRPEAPGRFPALVYRTPYGVAGYPERAELPLKAAKRGYLVFLVDVRGRYASEGRFHAYRQEPEDGFDTIEWAAVHPRSNGRVGTWGGSYPGYAQWLAMTEGPPHLAAAAPDMTPVDSHHFWYVGGAFSLTWYEWFYPLILPDLRRRAGDRSGPRTHEEARAAWEERREAVYRRRPLAAVPADIRPYAPYLREWITHPADGRFWDFADAEAAAGRVEAPALLLSGWYDDAYGPEGAVRGFRALRRRAATERAREGTILVLGPWTHTSLDVHTTSAGDLDFGPAAGLDHDGLLLDWFDRWLRGVPNEIDEGPPVRYFVMGENRWRRSEAWPPPGAEAAPFHLRSPGPAAAAGGADSAGAAGPAEGGESAGDAETVGGGRLALGARGDTLGGRPPDDEPPDTWVHDPRDPVPSPGFERAGAVDQSAVEAREDVLVYTSAPLERPVTVAGEVVAELWVSTDAPDTDFAFTLTDVHPDGTSYNVASPGAGYLRLRYRNGFDAPELAEPGEVHRIRIGGVHTAVRFEAGHRIRVRIASSRFPLYDPNPGTGTEIATETRLVPARQTVYHDAARPSRIWLPLLPREATRRAPRGPGGR